MPTFTGQLSIIGNQSNLDHGPDSLLVLAGEPDPAKAIFAATQFLVKIKKLHSGQMINVDGTRRTSGSVSIIAMTDASPAVQEAVAAAALESVGAARSQKKPRKRGSGKGGKKRARKSR